MEMTVYYRLRDPATAAPLWWLLSEGQRGAANWPADIGGWHLLVDYAETNGLGSIIARQLMAANPGFPDDILTRLEHLDTELTIWTESAREQALLVDSALRREEIPVYWLKGAAWGNALYQGVGTRPMRDLDLIVPGVSLEATRKVLADLGYETDPLAGSASQHLPRMVHVASGIKVDLHHRIVPRKIYGFPVKDLAVPWGVSNGVVSDQAKVDDIHFHLTHMISHIFHHSFYNLRLLHLFDVKLAMDAWQVPIDEVVEKVSETMPRKIVLDILDMVGKLFGGADHVRHNVGQRNVEGFVRNGSMPLLYPVTRIENAADACGVLAAEARRGWFVLRYAPGHWGRPPAALHPPK